MCCKMLHRRIVPAEEHRKKRGEHPRKNEPGAKYKQLKHHCLAVSCCREHLPAVKSVSGYLLATRPDLIPVGPNFWIKVNRKGISDMPPGLNRNKHLEQSGILKETLFPPEDAFTLCGHLDRGEESAVFFSSALLLSESGNQSKKNHQD